MPDPSFIPPLGDALSADEALSALDALLPEDPDFSTDALPDLPAPFGMTWQWDFSRNRFQLHGHQPVRVYNLSNLRVWIETQVNIARLAHPIYDDDIGMDPSPFGWIGGLATDPAMQQWYMEAVYAALMIHDRISNVTNFDFYQHLDEADDAIYVDFEVTTDNGELLPVSLAVA